MSDFPFIETPRPESGPTYAAPALEKGLDILELLAEAGEGMSTRAVADRLGRSKSEIFRMVFVLLKRGYLTRDPGTDTLSLTNRLFELGMRTPRPLQLTAVAVPAMEQLSDTIGESAHLVVPNRGETVVIATTAGGADVSFMLRLGYRRPLVDATSGLIILAFQTEAIRVRMIAESAALLDRAVDADALSLRFRKIRQQGYEMAESRDVVGVTDIGCPVLSKDRRAVASIVVPYLNRHGAARRYEQVVERLLRTCGEISDNLAA